MPMLYALQVLLSLALVLGLVKGLSVLAARYAPSLVVGARVPGKRRLEVLESTVLPGGVNLYVVRYGSEELLLAGSKAGLVQLHPAPGTPNAPGRAEPHEWEERQGH